MYKYTSYTYDSTSGGRAEFTVMNVALEEALATLRRFFWGSLEQAKEVDIK